MSNEPHPASEAEFQFGFMEVTADQNAAPNSPAPNGPRDLILRLYREVGISAVAAALEASARKPQGPIQCRDKTWARSRVGIAMTASFK